MSEKIVLVVDDDTNIRDVMVKICTYFKFKTHEARDGEEAWAQWQALKPDLTVTDIYMPKMNGIQLLRNIRRTNSNAKVILMTGFDHFKQLADDENSKPTDYFVKPFDIVAAGQKICKHLEG